MNLSFSSLEDIVATVAEGVRPAERLTVAEAAEKYRKINVPGSYVGPWLNSTTPYLVDPMNSLASHTTRGMIFAGPAQCGKTELFLNWQTFTVVCDPADMILYEKAQATARDFSIRRVDRLHRHTDEVGRRVIQHRNADNTYDKRYQSGIIVNLSWPAINEMSGRPIPRVFLTDYDRMPQDIDGEGEPYDLGRKRTTTFGSHAMCAAESSPGFFLENPNWIAKSPHEAPPTQGILKLYNRGDRRRWYWKCVNPKCRMAFEPDFSLFNWPKSEDLTEAAELATLQCPHCRLDYSHDPGDLPGKHEMNRHGRWVKDGMMWVPEGEVVGKSFRSDIDSYWLKGPAATFINWTDLVHRFLTAEKEYADTGTETSLITTVNQDQALPYTPKSQAEARLPETLKARSRDHGQRMVPHGVRYLVACVDVQKNRFVVQVHGVGVGGDIWVVDRFDVKKSRRLDGETNEHFWINPSAYFEDWKLLVEEVMTKTYPLIDGSGREMPIKITLCDSGGKEGVTTNAYNFVRWLRDGKEFRDASGAEQKQDEGEYKWVPGLYSRFQLVRGDSTPKAPRAALTYPDSQRKDRHAGARGEIPVFQLNSNMIKDTLNGMLDRTEARGGRINFPNWLPDWFYVELTVEIRDPAKGWLNPHGYRNESWDLLAYCVASGLTRQIALEHIDWNDPPSWAAEWDKNDLVFDPSKGKPFQNQVKANYDFKSLGDRLG